MKNAVKRIFSCKISFRYSQERARQKCFKILQKINKICQLCAADLGVRRSATPRGEKDARSPRSATTSTRGSSAPTRRCRSSPGPRRRSRTSACPSSARPPRHASHQDGPAGVIHFLIISEKNAFSQRHFVPEIFHLLQIDKSTLWIRY